MQMTGALAPRMICWAAEPRSSLPTGDRRRTPTTMAEASMRWAVSSRFPTGSRSRGSGWTVAEDPRIERESRLRDVLALFDALGIERAHVVSHDMVAFTAIQLTL